MIAKIKGIIDELKPTELILDVHGVGYHLNIPLSTYEKIQDKNDISLFVYTLHKEDQLKLFGFNTEQEKKLFSILININGIGPSIALSLLSGITIDSLIDSVHSGDVSYLVKVPGIGKSKAEKIIFELKRKIKKLDEFSIDSTERPTKRNDAVEALITLGFDELKSSKIVNDIIKDNPEKSVEYIIKETLKQISA